MKQESSIKVLFIDDNKAQMDSLEKKLNNNHVGIKVDTRYPLEFSKAIDAMSEITNNYDAILTDYKLNETNIPTENNNSYNVRYSGVILAQQFREMVSFGLLKKDIPIILTSKDETFKQKYDKEITGHDLFDWKVDKDYISNNSNEVCRKIASLVSGYKGIYKYLSSENILDLFGIDSNELYPSINVVIDFYKRKEYKPHAFSNFIIKKMVRYQGALISEELLAAKLGIDISKSKDWEKLYIEKLDYLRYKGVFWELEKRFWLHRLDDWWNTIDSYNYYENISATERVDLIKNNTGLQQLVAAKPIAEGYSEYYDTICILSKKPVAKEDSLLVAMESQEPWQLRDYVSVFNKLDKENKFEGNAEELRLDSSELEKFEAIKKG